MYNNKTNCTRKEIHKFNKPNNNKKKQNGAHFQYNKYGKYRQRYSNSNTFSQSSYEYDSNLFYKKDSKKIKKIKKKDLIEVNESYAYNYEDIEIKENSSSHENSTNDYQTQEKTSYDNYERNNSNFSNNIMDEDKSLTNEQDLNSSENNTIIFPNRNSLGKFNNNNAHIFSEDKENYDPNMIMNSMNTSHYSNSNRTECSSKENNNNNNNCNSIISSINLSSQDIKEAFYVPKKHNSNNIFNSPFSNSNSNSGGLNIEQNNIQENNNNNLQNYAFNDILNHNNSQNLNGLNILLNNNNNYLFCNQKIEPVQPFCTFDTRSSSSFHHKSSFDSFHSSIKSGSLLDNEKEKENTDILEIHVKITSKDTLIFKIRRYDDMFKTVKIFCEINKLDIKLIRPFIIYIIKALNSIYGIYNLKLKNDEIQFLKDIKDNFYPDDNDEEEKKEELINKNDPNIKNNNDYFNMNFPKKMYSY